VSMVGCGSFGSGEGPVRDRRVEYKKARVTPRLEIPPDLSSSAIEDTMYGPEPEPGSMPTLSAYTDTRRQTARPARSSQVLPEPDTIRIERDGDNRWMIVQADLDSTWEQVRSFWLDNGLILTREDPRVGIMETDWLENRADIKEDFLRNFLKKTLLDNIYSTPTRDKFRVRLERGIEPGSTEIYLTHYGMVETDQQIGGQDTAVIWEPRPSDPELEAEMLNRLMVYMGVEERKARRMLAQREARTPRARLIKDGSGTATLQLDEDFPQAWRLTGIALDRIGFAVEDQDRADGTYYVRYSDPFKSAQPKGFFSKLAFWKSDDKPAANRYLIRLEGEGAMTRVVVLDIERRPDRSTTAVRILTLLEEQLQ
jgi:outer membrane protein assembly factor BamC